MSQVVLNHYTILEGMDLVYYVVVQCCCIVLVLIMFVDSCFQLYAKVRSLRLTWGSGLRAIYPFSVVLLILVWVVGFSFVGV